jgi:hypothetical protein
VVNGLVVVPRHPLGPRIATQKGVVHGHVVRVGRHVAVAVDRVDDFVERILKQPRRIDGLGLSSSIGSSRVPL